VRRPRRPRQGEHGHRLRLVARGGDDRRPGRRPLRVAAGRAERGAAGRIRDLLERVDAVGTLLRAGADVDPQDAERNNPLLVCGENGDVAMLRAFIAAPTWPPRTASAAPR
jgi:hypothetical protein